MNKVITFPVVKKTPVKAAVLKAIDIEYIQQAILDHEALDVHIVGLPGEDIPEDLQKNMTAALAEHGMAVYKLLSWAMARDPESYEKYIHKSCKEIRDMPPISEGVQA